MEDIWYLQEIIDGKPIWGLFETSLLRKQHLNSIAAGLHNEKIVDEQKAQGGYVVVLLMEGKLIVSAHDYRAYLVAENGPYWSNDTNQDINYMPNPEPNSVLVLADGDLSIKTDDCHKIKADNGNRQLFCVDLKTRQMIELE